MKKWMLILLFLLLNAWVWAEDIRDVKPPLALPANYLILFVLLLMGVLVGLIFFLKYYQPNISRRELPVVIPNPPWVTAMEELDVLKSKNLIEHGQAKEYFTSLSDIVRRYIEERFGIRAPEMTTPEFLGHLRDSKVLTIQQKETLKYFLNSCDMVKFAQYGPSHMEADESFAFAQKFIEETKE